MTEDARLLQEGVGAARSESITDPVEKIVARALEQAGLHYQHEAHVKNRVLDFYIPDLRVFIECKAYHTERIAEQTAAVDNVIVIQGKHAAEMFAKLITSKEKK